MVVHDGPRLRAVARDELGEVLPDGDERDALALARRRDLVELLEGRDRRRLVQQHQEPARRAALRARRCLGEHLAQQTGEHRAEAALIVQGCGQVARVRTGEEARRVDGVGAGTQRLDRRLDGGEHRAERAVVARERGDERVGALLVQQLEGRLEVAAVDPGLHRRDRPACAVRREQQRREQLRGQRRPELLVPGALAGARPDGQVPCETSSGRGRARKGDRVEHRGALELGADDLDATERRLASPRCRRRGRP